MGRHARHVAPFARGVIAVDFSCAIEEPRAYTAEFANVDCVQADLLALPFADEAFDFVYSLGVLHHLDATDRALARAREDVPSGRSTPDLPVLETTRLEGAAARNRFDSTPCHDARPVSCAAHSVPRAQHRTLRWSRSAIPFAVGSRRPSTEDWPLFVYTKYPFGVLFNDQFDRFSAPIEKRYDPDEVRQLLERAASKM